MAEFRIRWKFRPRPDRLPAFERAYGPDGDWARLFRRAPGFLGTTLTAPVGPDGWWITEDRWESEAAHAAFLRHHGDAYAELDRACEALTLEEGRFDGA